MIIWYKFDKMMQNVAGNKIEEINPDITINKLINGTLEAEASVSHESSCNCGDHNHHH